MDEKNSIEGRKDDIRRQLNNYTKEVLEPYQQKINKFLKSFNTGFKIDETKHSYSGGVAISSYQLVINQTLIEVGNSNTSAQIPSFKNTLSAGDRSTLALSFFLAHLEQDNNLTSKIVVFDDPFNSQDAFRRNQTILEIIKIAKKCTQVLVLSHDSTFLKQIWDKCLPAERASLNLVDHRQKGSKIVPCDLEKACKRTTATDIDNLQAYVSKNSGELLDIIRKIRPVLETHMRSTYLNYFKDNDWLGEIVKKINDGGDTHPAWVMYEELNEINCYTAPYHHGENVVGSPSSAIDAAELLGFVRKTLQIVNASQA